MVYYEEYSQTREYQQYARNKEIIRMRLECIMDGDDLAKNILLDTVRRLNENNQYLERRLTHSESERFDSYYIH